MPKLAKTCAKAWAARSFKRELAALALLFWMALTYRVFWGASVEMIGALGTAYGTASTCVWLFVTAAFGMDAYAKQLQPRTP